MVVLQSEHHGHVHGRVLLVIHIICGRCLPDDRVAGATHTSVQHSFVPAWPFTNQHLMSLCIVEVLQHVGTWFQDDGVQCVLHNGATWVCDDERGRHLDIEGVACH